MAGYCTLVLYFHSPAARENTDANPFYHPFYPDVTHMRKDTIPSPAFPYCKRWKAGQELSHVGDQTL